MVHATHRWEFYGHVIAGSIEEYFDLDVVWLPESDDESNATWTRRISASPSAYRWLGIRPGNYSYNLVDTDESADAVSIVSSRDEDSGHEADDESDEPCAKRRRQDDASN